jgi:hypothetical protein
MVDTPVYTIAIAGREKQITPGPACAMVSTGGRRMLFVARAVRDGRYARIYDRYRRPRKQITPEAAVRDRLDARAREWFAGAGP